MSFASVIEQQVGLFGGGVKVKLIDLHPVLTELEKQLHAAAAIAEPEVQLVIDAALQVAETSLERSIIAQI